MTEDEKREQAEDEARLAGIRKAREAVVGACGGPWKRGMTGASGRADCPVCGKAKGLAFHRARYNGHIHAACDTAGCVSWME